MASLYRKKNSQYWYAAWRVGDHIRNRSTKVPVVGANICGIKEKPSQARARAQVIADGFEASEKSGLNSARTRNAIALLARHSTDSGTSVRAYCENYIAKHTGVLSDDTIRNLKRSTKLFIDHIGIKADAPLSIITRSDIKSFVLSQLQFVRRPTVRNYIAGLSRIFAEAFDAELIEKTPCFRIEIPRSPLPPGNRKEAFSVEDVKKMLEVLPWDWRSMVIFCLFTGGQRLGDLSLMTWDQIDLEAGIIKMTTQKTQTELRIPIIEPLRKHIESLPRFEGSPYVHPTLAYSHNGRSAPHISHQFISLITKAGIIMPPVNPVRYGRAITVKPKTFHSLRATAATLLHTIGIDPALAQKIVGHASRQVHSRYIRPDDAQKREAFEKLAELLPEGLTNVTNLGK